MGNYLKMKQRQQVIALLELGWTYRRIETETGVRRETVSRYDRWRSIACRRAPRTCRRGFAWDCGR